MSSITRLNEATPSAGTSYLVRTAHSCSLSRAEDAELSLREIRSRCFFFNLCSPETVFDLAKMLPGWRRVIESQEHALQRPHHS